MDELFTFGNTKKIAIGAALRAPKAQRQVVVSGDSDPDSDEESWSKGMRRGRRRKIKSSIAARLMSKSIALDLDRESPERDDGILVLDGVSQVTKLQKNSSSSPSPPPSLPAHLAKAAPKTSRKLLQSVDAALWQLKASKPPLYEAHTSREEMSTVAPQNGEELTFNLRVRCRGRVHKYTVTKGDMLLEICGKLASELGTAMDQILLSHKTYTLNPANSLDTLGLTTADIIDAVVMEKPVVEETTAVDLSADNEMEVVEQDSESLSFKIQSSAQSIVYRMKRLDPLQKAMSAFALSLDVSLSKLRFMFDGDSVDPGQTAADLDMEEDDVIDAEVVERKIAEKYFSLPSLHIPSFANALVIKAAEAVETKHEVVFSVLNQMRAVKRMADFGKVVKEVSRTSPEVMQVIGFSDYLSIPGSAPIGPLQWLWEDDNGGYNLYPPDICTTLTQSYQASSTSMVMCRIGTTDYRIDFNTMTQTNLRTNFARPIICEATVCWYYEDEQGQLMPYSPQDSASIENMYQASAMSTGVLVVNGRSISFNFMAMLQVEFPTMITRHIERRLGQQNDQLSADCELTMHVCGVAGNLSAAVEELKEKLGKSVVKLQYQLPSHVDQSMQKSVLELAKQYCIQAQIVGDDKKLEISGVQGYADKVLHVIQQKIPQSSSLQPTVTLSSTDARYPSTWESQVSKIELKVVSPESSEWNKVFSLVRKTLPNAKLIKLERIQNQWQWDRYSFAKQRMHEKNNGVVNEKELFHGTRTTAPEKIYKSEQGFDFRFSSQGMWGTGTYFAVNASYSNNYAYQMGRGRNSQKQILLANVLTGETCCCPPDGTLRKPPNRPRASGTFADELYDSVSGNTDGCNIFVIYDHEKAYPTYLITYR